jgi:hypothetical protein
MILTVKLLMSTHRSVKGLCYRHPDVDRILLAGAFFMITEQLLMNSRLHASLTQLLNKNPRMSADQARECVPMMVTRFVGFIHNTAQV